jgi:hypothetical protein
MELLDFACSVRKSFAFLRLHLFGAHPFCSDSFSFHDFLLLSAFSLFFTSRVASSFSDCSKPITPVHHFRKTRQKSGKHSLQWIGHSRAGVKTSGSWTRMLPIQFAVVMNLIPLNRMKGICNNWNKKNR